MPTVTNDFKPILGTKDMTNTFKLVIITHYANIAIPQLSISNIIPLLSRDYCIA